jgi:type IV secretory pathway VirB2 component (pilin)
MERLLVLVGNLTAVVGVAACLFAGVVRLTGVYQVAGFELRTLFVVGIGLMAMGILAKLHTISVSLRR